MISLRPLALCASLLVFSGCGGGEAFPPPPGASPTPSTPTTSSPSVVLSAQSGSSQHNSLSWSGGSAGTVWRLERRREGGGDYQLAAEVESSAGLWLDSGLSADTGYVYRLVRSDGGLLATASVRTGTEAVLTTPAPQALGSGLSLPITPSSTRIALSDGSLELDLPAGSFSQSGTAVLQPIANPVADGIGAGLSFSLPERPARTLTLSLRYDLGEDVDEVMQDRIALRQADGSWWLLPLQAHDAERRLLKVSLPPSLWVAQSTVSALQVAPHAGAVSVKGEFVRVKAHKLLPAAASVRTLGSQRFVPVSIYVMRSSAGCEDSADAEVCVPTPMLRDATVPVLNSKTGFQRQWTLDGNPTPEAALGSMTAESGSGVVYSAPAQVPASNPLTLLFQSIHIASGRRLVLSAKIRVVEDVWVGNLVADLGEVDANHRFKLDTRWSLDAAQSSATRRVYRPSGSAEHLYRVADPVCTHTVSPTRVALADAQTSGLLVVDESSSPARYRLELATVWNSTLNVSCPKGSASAPAKGGHFWAAEGVISNGRIEGQDSNLGERSWTLGRVQ